MLQNINSMEMHMLFACRLLTVLKEEHPRLFASLICMWMRHHQFMFCLGFQFLQLFLSPPNYVDCPISGFKFCSNTCRNSELQCPYHILGIFLWNFWQRAQSFPFFFFFFNSVQDLIWWKNSSAFIFFFFGNPALDF